MKPRKSQPTLPENLTDPQSPLETIRRHAPGRPGNCHADVAKVVAIALPVLASCSGPQSAFTAAGTEADSVITLFYVMLAGSVVIWLFVIGLSFYAVRTTPEGDGARVGVRLIIWGGCVFPTVVLALLLYWGLEKMPDYRRPADGPTIAVSGERFWWRVAYDVQGDPGIVKSLPPGGVESANELWIPVGRRTQILLGSPDVIHSFWVPALAGKTDAIPGRVNRIVLEPIVEGVFTASAPNSAATPMPRWACGSSPSRKRNMPRMSPPRRNRPPSPRDAGSRRSSRTAAAPATPYGERQPTARSVPTSPMSPGASPSPPVFWRPPRRTSPPSSAPRSCEARRGDAGLRGAPGRRNRGHRGLAGRSAMNDMPDAYARADEAVRRGQEERLGKVWETPKGWRYWTSVNNTQVGLWYTATAFIFMLFAACSALMIRAQLAVPDNDFLSAELYNQVFTLHGTVMMFLFAVPIFEAVAIFLLPPMLGARDLPFPRLRRLRLLELPDRRRLRLRLDLLRRGARGGWFMYPPLTTERSAGHRRRHLAARPLLHRGGLDRGRRRTDRRHH